MNKKILFTGLTLAVIMIVSALVAVSFTASADGDADKVAEASATVEPKAVSERKYKEPVEAEDIDEAILKEMEERTYENYFRSQREILVITYEQQPEITYDENGDIVEIYGVPAKEYRTHIVIGDEYYFVVLVDEGVDMDEAVKTVNECESVKSANKNFRLIASYPAEDDGVSERKYKEPVEAEDIDEAILQEMREHAYQSYINGLREIFTVANELPEIVYDENGDIESIYGVKAKNFRIQDFFKDEYYFIITVDDDVDIDEAIEIVKAQDTVRTASMNLTIISSTPVK